MFHYITPEKAGISSEKILAFLKTLEQYNFCTHSFIMARGNNIFAEGYYEPFHKDFQHRMYSVSKSFVSVAVGLAVEDGLLRLDDKLVQFFPEYVKSAEGELPAELAEMTVREMLTMETCTNRQIKWFYAGLSDRCEAYFKTPVERIPGTTWCYDSPGSFMLGCIVERLTGKPFLEYLKERFLLKGGFSKEAYCLKCPGGHSFGDSGVMCTAGDLLVFARFVMDGGVIDGVRYMNEEYLAEATKKQVSNSHGGEAGFGTDGYGYQIWKMPKDGFAFIGMGDQLAICDREKDFIFIITSDNQGDSGTTRTILYHELWDNIIPALGEALPENESAQNELAAYVKGLKLFHLKDATESEWMDRVHNKTYKLDANPMGIKWVRLEFAQDKGTLFYENEQGEKALPFGLGHNEFGKFPQEGYSDLTAAVPAPGNLYDCAASADWPEPQKLRIKVQIIDKYFGNMSIEFGFKDDRVGIYMMKTAEAFLDEYEGYANGRVLAEGVEP